MKSLVVIAALAFAGWHFSGGELPFTSSAGAYDSSGNPTVWLFSSDDCGEYCDTMRDRLNKRKVDFEEKRIDRSNSNDNDVKFWKKHGRNQFPVVAAGNQTIIGTHNAELATVLGLNFGEKHLTRTEKKLFKKHFYSDGSPKIVMYAANWCGYCKKLRAEFENNNVDFVEIDLDRHAKKDLIFRTMEISGYPSTWVGYTRVRGITLEAVNKIVDNYEPAFQLLAMN